jgi:leader peptidase (prepilin peptidase) / N-methyltransferase
LSALLVPALVAGGGAVAGELVRRHVVRGSHRRPEDEGAPRAHRWLPVAAALLWFVVARTSWPDDPAWVVTVAATSVPLLWLAAVDLEVQRLPDRVTLPLLVASPLLAGVLALVERDASVLGRALLAGVVLGACFAVLAMIGDGMGGGDVKLAPTLGILLGVLGWAQVLLAVLLMFVSASVFGLFLVVFRRAGRRTLFAFGPFLIGGALTVLALG